MTTENKQEEVQQTWLAVPKEQLEAILKHLGEMPFKMVAPIAPTLMTLRVQEVKLNFPEQAKA